MLFFLIGTTKMQFKCLYMLCFRCCMVLKTYYKGTTEGQQRDSYTYYIYKKKEDNIYLISHKCLIRRRESTVTWACKKKMHGSERKGA